MSVAARNRRNRNRGKQHEREVAQRLGGTRVGLMGGVDVDAGPLAVECKSTSAMPSYLRKYHEQAVRHAGPGQLPVVVIHEKGSQYDSDFVMLSMADFVEHVLPLIRGDA